MELERASRLPRIGVRPRAFTGGGDWAGEWELAEEYEPEVGEWEGLDSQALQKASMLPPHFIPHLVVHGNALPMLKVAAVGASSSRACARRHLPCPGPRRPPRRPSAARKPAGCGTSSATPIAAQFRENNFRPLCPRRTDSVITFPAPPPARPAHGHVYARAVSPGTARTACAVGNCTGS